MAGSSLISFDAATPGTTSAPIPITGLQMFEAITALDFRPSNGVLYGFGSTGRLYTINRVTGTATQVGSGSFGTFSGAVGFDYLPTTDQVRIVTEFEQNARVSPETGQLVATDAVIHYAAGDINQGASPGISSVAYTNNVAGAATTTAYAIDSDHDILTRIGGIDGNPSSNGGELTTRGSLGPDTDGSHFDIAPDGTGWAVLRTLGGDGLYTLNLATGEATLVGTVTTAAGIVAGMAVEFPPPPPPTPTPSATPMATASPTTTAAPTQTATPIPTATATATASSTPTPTPSPSPTPGPSESPTPEPGGLKGDMDCDGDVDAVDALFILRDVASLPVNLPKGCEAIGSPA